MLIERIIGDGEIITRDKVAIAIDRLQAFEPEEGYYLAFSGGKDSVVIKALADMAGVKYDAHYSLTTVDPPELVRFIKEIHPDVEIDKTSRSMWKLIADKGMPPTRIVRYCCQELKETGGKGRICITGVRNAESNARASRRPFEVIGSSKKEKMLFADNDEDRRLFENCTAKGKRVVNPIIDWTDCDVWEFIQSKAIPYCSLYDEGFTRLGCIGCPIAGEDKRKKEFDRWPTYKIAYIRAFDRMIERRKQKGLPCDKQFESGNACFNWWIQEKQYDDKAYDDQIELEE